MREETVATYVRFLVDLEQGAAGEAIEGLIATSVAMLTVAAIRRQVINEEPRLPTTAQAWVSISDSTRTEELHELAKEARELMGDRGRSVPQTSRASRARST